MIDRWRPRRSPARYLAPLALVATIAATVIVIEGSSGTSATSAPTSHSSVRSRTGRTRAARRRHGSSTTPTASAYYTVKPGDSLSTISARTGVPLVDLQSLNPVAASHPLQVGQRLKLRQ